MTQQPEPQDGKLVWLDAEVCEELERAVEQGVMGDSINEVLRKMLRLPKGVFTHPTANYRGPRTYSSD
jgi:hypothetical protein